MKNLLNKYPVTTYYALLWILSLILLYPILSLNTLFLQIQFLPAITVLVFYLMNRNEAYFKPLKSSFTFRASQLKWVILIFILVLLPTLAISLTLSLLGHPYTPWKNNGFGYFSVIFGELILGIAGEEIGWRGFLLPLLHKRHNLFASSIIIAALWGVWHIFTYISYGLIGCIAFLVFIITYSLIIAFFYIKGNGSLILSYLAHFFINFFTVVLYFNRMSATALVCAAVFFSIPCMILVLLNKTIFFKNSYEENCNSK